MSGLLFAPYPNSFRAPFHHGPGPNVDTIYIDFLEEWLLVHQVEPEQIAGVLIEPILEKAVSHTVRWILAATHLAMQTVGLEANTG